MVEYFVNYWVVNFYLLGYLELGFIFGIKFSFGRLGYMWFYINGVVMVNFDKVLFCLGFDGF